MKAAKLNSRQRRAGPKPAPEPLKLDFCCGSNKREGFKGVDSIAFPNVDFLVDLAKTKLWPWQDNSVAEAHCSHGLEHFDQLERIHFLNELYRVLVPGGKCQIITPWWASGRAYGDPTHKWAPVSGFYWNYLKRDWRIGAEKPCPLCAQTPQNGQPCTACAGKRTVTIPANAPHTDVKYWPEGFSCDFDVVWGWSLHPQIAVRNQEYQQHALTFWIEAAQDMIATLTACK
jgi:hypothetical protein